MSEPSLLAGLDIGGSKVLSVAVETRRDGTPPVVIGQVRMDTLRGPEGLLDTAFRALTALAGQITAGPHSGSATDLFDAVGIGVPGLVDAERGAVTHAVNLGVGTGGLALADRLRHRVNLPVTVENDVNAAAFGASAELQLGPVDLAYLSIGTGVAAGVVLAGVLRRGPHNAAGEIGHIPVDPAGPVCGCGQRGCLEALASGSAIAARWPPAGAEAEPAGTEADAVAAVAASGSGGSVGLGRSRAPAQELFDAAEAGDPAALAIRDEISDHLATAVRLIMLTVDVDRVVLGGGVAEVGEPLRSAVAAALDRQAANSAFLRGLDLSARLMLVPRGRPVAAVGAALLALPQADRLSSAFVADAISSQDVPA